MDLSYAYANARIKGMKSNLLGESMMRELMQVKTIDEITALLEQTPYKQDLVEASREFEGVQRIDIALHNNMGRTIGKVARVLPPAGAALFAILRSEWEAENFKRILSKKALGLDASSGDYFEISNGGNGKAGNLKERLFAAKTFAEAMEIIAARWGSREFKSAFLKIARKDPDLRLAAREIEIERVRQLEALSKAAGDPLVRKIVQQRLAAETAMAILRLKKEGVKIVHSEHVAFKNRLANRLLGTEDFKECIKLTANAFGLPAETAAKGETSLSSLEIALEKKTVERVLRWTRMSVLDFATAVGFVYLKNVEISNLRKIAFANAYGLKQELGELVFAINA